jgi:hypothetical protein
VPEDDKEVIFMGINNRDDYEKAKEKQRLDAEVLPEAASNFWKHRHRLRFNPLFHRHQYSLQKLRGSVHRVLRESSLHCGSFTTCLKRSR